MAKTKITDVVTKMVDLLNPLSSEERRRIIGATLTLLGEDQGEPPQKQSQNQDDEGKSEAGVPKLASLWMKQNSVLTAELQQVFHLSEGTAALIAPEIPGKSTKEKVLNAYILTGAGKLLESGSPSFDDKTAKAICNSAGCYDSTNHSKYLNGKGNEFTGSKDKGWTLTAPGLKKAAALIKQIAGEDA